ncbi:MAG TPA: hypothetical protein VK735_13155 [Pseudonocardia sp.]|jgi:hypothetical protein|uniref:hypothetical protein n=1 Tax=Pseudonocardia sp. TaxID=60912 RepID=UPI002C98D8A1|nr:hypothetical protein [Pseudonocardia sp.]HTF48392.1 hypothetical protein [Pseudonocardia sp.]
MTSSEQPEADALEQQQPLYPEDAEQADELPPELGLEVNEADAVEQLRVANIPEYDEDYPADA